MLKGIGDQLLGNRRALWIMLLGLCGGIFALDLALPLGVAIGMLYAGPVFLAARYASDSAVPKIAALCTVLVLTGAAASPTLAGAPAWIWSSNRLLSTIVIWAPIAFLIRDNRNKRLLQAVNGELEKKVTIRTMDLERSHQDLRALTSRLITIQEEERQRLARDLHDDFSQRLGMVMLDLGVVEHDLPKIDDSRLRHAKTTVSRLVDDVRRLAHDFHPSILIDLGLAVAIRRLLDDWATCTNVKVLIDFHDVPLQLPEGVAICLYRIAQESLSNIAKHSRASMVEVFLGHQSSGIELRIRDNGVGCSASPGGRCPQGLGLLSMKERASQVGGEVAVGSPLSGGTIVQAWVPLKEG